MALNLSKKEQMKMEERKMYTCPTHGDIVSNTEGKCPKCGMDLTMKKQETKKG